MYIPIIHTHTHTRKWSTVPGHLSLSLSRARLSLSYESIIQKRNQAQSEQASGGTRKKMCTTAPRAPFPHTWPALAGIISVSPVNGRRSGRKAPRTILLRPFAEGTVKWPCTRHSSESAADPISWNGWIPKRHSSTCEGMVLRVHAYTRARLLSDGVHACTRASLLSDGRAKRTSPRGGC
jgi:hypothetical protein